MPTDNTAPPGLPLLVAAELQDQMISTSVDLERLQRLLDDAAQALMVHFYGATRNLERLLRDAGDLPPDFDRGALHAAMEQLSGAVTKLQFHDMGTQLIAHARQRLASCADRLAAEVMGDDEDGPSAWTPPPQRPNPVTQDEMDAGSIELF